jgi:hypothetical protein
MIGTLTLATNIALTILLLPGRIVEEGLHALVALPWADVVSVRLEPGVGAAETVVQYRAETPDWAIRATYLVPEVAAWATGVVAVGVWLLGGAVWWPATTTDWMLLGLVGAQWVAVALPSAQDHDRSPSEEVQP